MNNTEIIQQSENRMLEFKSRMQILKSIKLTDILIKKEFNLFDKNGTAFKDSIREHPC